MVLQRRVPTVLCPSRVLADHKHVNPSSLTSHIAACQCGFSKDHIQRALQQQMNSGRGKRVVLIGPGEPNAHCTEHVRTFISQE